MSFKYDRSHYEPPRGFDQGDVLAHATVGNPVLRDAAFNRASLDSWLDSLRSPDTCAEDRFAEIMDVISPLLEFIAAPRETHGVASRVFVLLYAVRPDLVHYESMKSAAQRFGVPFGNLTTDMRRLKDSLPGFTFRKVNGNDFRTSSRAVSRKLGVLRSHGAKFLARENFETERSSVLSM